MTARSRICAALVSAAALTVPAAANAATVSYDGGTGTLHYQAAAGEANLLSLQKNDSGRLLIIDAYGIALDDQSGGQCQPGYDTYVLDCAMPSAVDADLGDLDDRGSVSWDFPASFHATIHGGDGKDRLDNANNKNPVTFDGGPGNDEITGGETGDTLLGGAGNDMVKGRGGADSIDAGDGNDSLIGDGYNVDPAPDVIDGGPGVDTIDTDWSDPTDPAPPLVNVTLGGGADDGRPGEGDDVHGVEQLHVYSAGTYVGSDGPDDINVFQVDKPSTLKGGAGDDSLDASDGADTLDGGPGNDVVDGGFGDDHIVGGPGTDQIHGDTPEGECGVVYCKLPFGNDTIDARDGQVDSIDCGVGEDTVVADANDVVASDCETVDRGAGGGSNGGSGSGSGGGTGGQQNGGNPGAKCVVPKLRGLTLTAAKKKIASAGCKVKVKRAASRAVARGRVIKASRTAGARVKRGTTVAVTVSRGRR